MDNSALSEGRRPLPRRRFEDKPADVRTLHAMVNMPLICHHAGDGAGVRRGPAGLQISWHRAGDQHQDDSLGLCTGLDMRNQSLEFMQSNFGKAGSYYYWILRGVDDREAPHDRIRNPSAPRTLLHRPYRLRRHGVGIAAADRQSLEALRGRGNPGRTVTLKMKFTDFELISRSRTVASTIGSSSELENVTVELLKALFPMQKAVRLLGVSDIRIQTRRNSRRGADSLGALIKRPFAPQAAIP